MFAMKVIFAFFYDFILLFAVWFFAAIPFVVWQGDNLQTQNTAMVAFQAYLLGVTYVYLTFFWTKSGQTPGLRTWKLRLQTTEGYLLNRHQANIRFLLGILLFLIGWILLFTPYKQTLQDKLAQTEIVPAV